MHSYWDGKIVVTVVPVPVNFVKALLESGAKAVVCRQMLEESNDIDSEGNIERDAILGFFQAFYDVLLAGFAIVKALSAAGNSSTHFKMSFLYIYICLFTVQRTF